jgi:hypothetical protein
MNNEKSHAHFAGRLPAGTEHAVTVRKDGIRHVRCVNGEEKEYLAAGLACSECFSGANLYKILQPGFQYEQKVMEDLQMGNAAAPLSIHTSLGVSEALSDFIHALEPHLPWKNANELDWCVSLQMEGASALWAAVDMLLQTRDDDRIKVAVGAKSYHG